MVLVKLVLFLLPMCPAGYLPPCEPHWLPYFPLLHRSSYNHCYRLLQPSPPLSSSDEAGRQCKALDACLVRIGDDRENAFLAAYLTSLFPEPALVAHSGGGVGAGEGCAKVPSNYSNYGDGEQPGQATPCTFLTPSGQWVARACDIHSLLCRRVQDHKNPPPRANPSRSDLQLIIIVGVVAVVVITVAIIVLICYIILQRNKNLGTTSKPSLKTGEAKMPDVSILSSSSSLLLQTDHPFLERPLSVASPDVLPGPTEPGSVDPGSVVPGSVDPGSVDPGSVVPGSVDPGMMDPGSSDVSARVNDACVQAGSGLLRRPPRTASHQEEAPGGLIPSFRVKGQGRRSQSREQYYRVSADPLTLFLPDERSGGYYVMSVSKAEEVEEEEEEGGSRPSLRRYTITNLPPTVENTGSQLPPPVRFRGKSKVEDYGPNKRIRIGIRQFLERVRDNTVQGVRRNTVQELEEIQYRS